MQILLQQQQQQLQRLEPSIPTLAAPQASAQLKDIRLNTGRIDELVRLARAAQRRLPPRAVEEQFVTLENTSARARELAHSLHLQNMAASEQGATLDPSTLQRGVETTRAQLDYAMLLLQEVQRLVETHVDETTIEEAEIRGGNAPVQMPLAPGSTVGPPSTSPRSRLSNAGAAALARAAASAASADAARAAAAAAARAAPTTALPVSGLSSTGGNPVPSATPSGSPSTPTPPAGTGSGSTSPATDRSQVGAGGNGPPSRKDGGGPSDTDRVANGNPPNNPPDVRAQTFADASTQTHSQGAATQTSAPPTISATNVGSRDAPSPEEMLNVFFEFMDGSIVAFRELFNRYAESLNPPST